MTQSDSIFGAELDRLKRLLTVGREESDENSTKQMPKNASLDLLMERPGGQIGRYKLLEKVGEGGAGVVYVAEQKEPVKRRVALKIIKLGMDTKQVVARFEAERQALALMDHPNIAKVFDAGATETGRPYFVMELVRGIPITQYCDQEELSTETRLELFINVCNAIQHAHQKGIIHRDVKPSNIMVTLHDGVSVPKVIDFGIAKAIQQDLTDKTVYTQFQHFVGTPPYMSPEQAEMSGLDIDTRSDIYSLGVLLYELLTGRTPFDPEKLMRSGIDAMRKTIRETEVPKPSTKVATLQGDELTTTAKRRSVDTAKLLHQLRGDLDWIVMKCLEKDRTRRYETANSLAMDIERHLKNEPVVARSPSRFYRIQKSVRRNKLVFTAGGIVAMTLLLGTVVSVWQAVLATQASQRESRAHQETAVALEAARQSEQLAKEEALAARRNLYAIDIHLAQQALQEGDTGRARMLLQRHITDRKRAENNVTGGATNDLRGWEWRYLWDQLQSGKPKVFATLPGAVLGLDVSPDGRHLAASTTAGLLKLWELPSGDEEATIEPGMGLPTKPVFFPDSSRLVYHYLTPRSDPGLLKIWDLRTQQVSRRISYPNGIGPKAVGPSGHRILFGAWPGVVRLFDLRTGLAPWETRVSAGAEMHTSDSFLFAETDGREWVLGDPNGDIRVLDVETGRPITHWKALSGPFTAMKMSHDGRLLASAGVSIKVWDYQTHKLLHELKGHQSWVSDLEFTSDSRRLISSSADQTVRLWDLNTWTEQAPPLRGADQEVWEVELSPDERTIYAGAKNGKICVWDSKALPGKDSPVIVGDVERFALSRSGDRLTVLSTGHSVKTGAIEDGIALATADYAGTDNSFVSLSPDGNQLIVGKTNGRIEVYSIATGALLHSNQVHNAAITRVRMLASGNRLLSSDRERNLLLQNINAGKPKVWRVEMKDWETFYPFQTFAVSPDEHTVAAGSFSGRVTLWDLSTGKKVGSFTNPSPQAIIYGLAFSPDGHTLATADEYGAVRLWDTATLSQVGDPLQGHRNGSRSLTFSPDGRRLISGGGGDNAVLIWDLATRQELMSLQREGGTYQLAFSPDGIWLFALIEHTLYAWRTAP